MPTYTDASGLTQNQNPVTLDANGEADVWLSGYTKLVLYDAFGTLVWSKDNVSSSPALSSSSLQWVPQSSQVSFGSVSATNSQVASFTVWGNQVGTYPAGTAIQATITGGNIYGIVQSSTASGTPVITTVAVLWNTTPLNASVTAVATGIVSAGIPNALPILPTQPHTANYTFAGTDLYQQHVVNSANATQQTLMAPSSVPDGAYIDVFNAGSANTTVIGTINGSANLVISQYAGKRIFMSAATGSAAWYAK
jgi:hypothetical protein